MSDDIDSVYTVRHHSKLKSQQGQQELACEFSWDNYMELWWRDPFATLL